MFGWFDDTETRAQIAYLYRREREREESERAGIANQIDAANRQCSQGAATGLTNPLDPFRFASLGKGNPTR